MPQHESNRDQPQAYDWKAYAEDKAKDAHWDPPAHWPLFAEMARDKLLEECRRVLDDAGVRLDDHCRHQYDAPENSLEWIASRIIELVQWLDLIQLGLGRRYLSEQEALVFRLNAELLGRLQERMFWRFGVDPMTGERREALGLRERSETVGRRRGVSERTKAKAKARAQAHQLARRILAKRKSPVSERELARQVLRAWPGEKPGFSTIRRYLTDFAAHN